MFLEACNSTKVKCLKNVALYGITYVIITLLKLACECYDVVMD